MAAGVAMSGSDGTQDPNPGCRECGRPLGDDPDDELIGDAFGPLCGECVRVREFESDLMFLDSSDGSLDDEIDLVIDASRLPHCRGQPRELRRRQMAGFGRGGRARTRIVRRPTNGRSARPE